MNLSDLGERKIIELLSEKIDIGDDAAWGPLGKNFLIFSSDMLYEKTHWLPGMSWQQFGKLAVTVNLSDIAAMGAQPLAFLLSYGSGDMKLERFQEIIEGVREQCGKFKVRFAGGDTNEIKGKGVVLAGSILGVMEEKPVLRSGAKIGDLIGITGKLGAGFGVEILTKGKEVVPDYKKIVEKALEPEPRVKEGLILGRYTNSLTDISDSLAVSLHAIARGSKVGMEIELGKLPLIIPNNAVLPHALYGGGDYELLFTFSEENLQELRGELNFSLIGRVIKEKKVVGTRGGRGVEIKEKGYGHFSK